MARLRRELKLLPGIDVKLGTRLACLAVSGAALFFIVRKVDVHELANVFERLNGLWLAAAAACFGVSMLLASWRWHLMLRLVRATVHPTATIRSVVTGHFFNTLLLGPAGGDFAKSALYARWYGFRTPDIIASSFLDRILGGGGNLMFAALGFGLAISSGFFAKLPPMGIPKEYLWGGGLGLALALGTAVYVRHFMRKDSPVVRTMTSFLAAGKQLLRAPKAAALGFALSFFVQITYSGVFALCLVAVVHRPLEWSGVLWTLPVISFVGGMPVSVAGAGVREGAALVLLGLAGIEDADAVAASLLVLSVYLLWAALSGLWLWREEWRFRRSPHAELPKTISAVVPTWNEADQLAATLEHLRRIPEITEIIVSDAKSQDGTAEVAARLGCRVLQGTRGRGSQMRSAAAQATGDVVLLIHADTWAPPEAGEALINSLRDRSVVGGGFWKKFREPTWMMAGSRLRCMSRLWVSRRVAGDQGIYARRRALEEAGGVPDLPLMEEFELCRRLRRRGRLTLAGATVRTSTRRFQKLGVLRTYLRMGRVTLEYYLGVPPGKLQRLYERE